MLKALRKINQCVRWAAVPTKLGILYLAQTDCGVICITLPGEAKKKFFRSLRVLAPGAKLEEDSVTLRTAAKQLGEYAERRRKKFDLPLDLRVSPFQGRVLAALRRIPFGRTRTYGQIASVLGKPKASRAVGLACRNNPVPLVIPCHRVIGHDGSLVGFGGGLEMKRRLLDLELSP